MLSAARYSFWLKTRRVTLALLTVWLMVSLCVPWFARDLDQFIFLGFPLGYWLAAEGALLVYGVLIAVYVVVMDRMEAALLAQAATASSASSANSASSATAAPAAPLPPPTPARG